MGHFRTTAAEEVNGHRCTLLVICWRFFFIWLNQEDIGHFHLF